MRCRVGVISRHSLNPWPPVHNHTFLTVLPASLPENEVSCAYVSTMRATQQPTRSTQGAYQQRALMMDVSKSCEHIECTVPWLSACHIECTVHTHTLLAHVALFEEIIPIS
jgi:hypothetical protein